MSFLVIILNNGIAYLTLTVTEGIIMKTWTVKELIEKLECYDGDLKVVTMDGAGPILPIAEVVLDDVLEIVIIK